MEYKSGQIINDFTLIESGSKKGEWIVKHGCGNVYQARLHLLKRQSYCKNCKPKLSGSEHHSWKGFGEISYDLYTTYKHSAYSKNLEFEVSIEYLWNLFLEQNRRCVFTGEELYFNKTYNGKKLKTASPDRIDSSIGYVDGNIQWVHRDVNKLKKNFTDKRFIEICLKIANNVRNSR